MLQSWGFDPWFAAHAAEMVMEGCGVARVCAVDRGAYRIRGEGGEVPAELAGRLAYHTDNPADLPCVGDWVTAQWHSDGTAAIIHRVFPRRTVLRRKAAGDGCGVQMIAANIDTAFIVQSCHYDFNPGRLERYLVMLEDGGVEPVVVLTKTDLVTPDDLANLLAVVAAVTPARVIALSSVTGAGLDVLRQALVPGRTYCLLGSSGVGKTTLLNQLTSGQAGARTGDGHAHATRAVSATGEGTHTTTRRQLTMLDGGSLVVDTPGMREVGTVAAADGVDAGFADIALLAGACRYADCRHEREAGCAVRAAVDRGELSATHYRNYLKLRKEAEFSELSQLDRRRKDKAFGKMVKSVKKHMGY
ncbi:ribosome small subunit-dependent GTPase A [Nitratidesulfovibrio termitidis]|uniref:ribosome small subunit-dependent GTPase A n=1 Tax=Nitratidesulfovibrio termitidis TaxID=42252 RepID=UPI000425254C|nr:ribosome small subunit-dependent GTPase A [Nitratidesulfovibrio termitidis]